MRLASGTLDRRRLALKVTLERQGLALARLAREAQIATRVQHANVVAVVDADVAKAGYVYLVMELVEGCSLGEYEGRKDVVWLLDACLAFPPRERPETIEIHRALTEALEA